MVKVTTTVGDYIREGYAARVFHDVIGCAHSAEVDLVALAVRYGPNLNMHTYRQWVLDHFTCSRCKANFKPFAGNMTMHVTPPPTGKPKLWDVAPLVAKYGDAWLHPRAEKGR